MKYATLLLFVIAVAVSCKKEKYFNINENRYIELSTQYLLNLSTDTFTNSDGRFFYSNNKKSNTLLFSYNLYSDVPDSDDMGYGSSLYFTADSGVTSFTYDAAELQKRLTYYQQYDGWGGGGQYPITKGTISGYKDGYYWQVTINVELPVQDNITNTNYIKTTSTFRIGPVL